MEIEDRFSAEPGGAGFVVLLRHVTCVICCKKKRHECAVCGGTGIRRVEWLLAPADAQRLAAELTGALR